MFPIRNAVITGGFCLGMLLAGPVAAHASSTAAPGSCSEADVALARTISHLVDKDVGCHEAARLRYKGGS